MSTIKFRVALIKNMNKKGFWSKEPWSGSSPSSNIHQTLGIPGERKIGRCGDEILDKVSRGNLILLPSMTAWFIAKVPLCQLQTFLLKNSSPAFDNNLSSLICNETFSWHFMVLGNKFGLVLLPQIMIAIYREKRLVQKLRVVQYKKGIYMKP